MKKNSLLLCLLIGTVTPLIRASASVVVHLQSSLPTGYLGEDRAYRALESTLYLQAIAACAPLRPFRDKAWQVTGAAQPVMKLETDFRCGEIQP